MTDKASQDENEIKSLKSQLDALQREVRTKENMLKEKDGKIEALETKIEGMDTEIKALQEQIPKKIAFEKAEEVIKGAACPNCGIPTYEEYKTEEGARTLIRKYCSACGWIFTERPEIAVALEAEVPEEIEKEIKIFNVKRGKVEAATTLDSTMVAIIADPLQEIVWIWKGAASGRFEYAEATKEAARIKNELIRTPHAHIERVEEGDEPENFPKFEK